MKSLVQLSIIGLIGLISLKFYTGSLPVPAKAVFTEAKAACSVPAVAPSPDPLYKILDARVEYFRQTQREKTGPAIARSLEKWFSQLPGRVEHYLDWQYSFTTRLKVTGNMLRDGGNWVTENVCSLVGKHVSKTPNHNREMSIKAFEDIVISEMQLSDALRNAGNIYESELRKQATDFIIQTNQNLSSALEKELHIQIPPKVVSAEFIKAMLKSASTLDPKSSIASLIMAACVSDFTGTLAGQLIGSSVSEFLTSEWYANLVLSGKIAVWLGLSTTPVGISTVAGVAGGAASLGVGLLAWAAVDSIFEWWTRPKARKKAIDSLETLKTKLLDGDESCSGLRKIGLKGIDDLSDSLRETYRETIRKIMKIS
ncbi:MAG: hypothetical protein HQM09_23335 [Candidatus Riflebacteria bacterium]|nr:hypothetical protein [Candidatus Riflebacteria bacterium]